MYEMLVALVWKSASQSISTALVVYLKTILGGPEIWPEDETIRRAVVIESGVIQAPQILSFQKRELEYPHGTLDDNYDKLRGF